MDGVITYLNTDLDLVSAADLRLLVTDLERIGLHALHVTEDHVGHWHAAFEADDQFFEPETCIAAMVTAIESLPSSLRALWDGCSQREFNIGYDCGLEPWAFNQGLSASLLARMAALNVSLRLTLYPDRDNPFAKPSQQI